MPSIRVHADEEMLPIADDSVDGAVSSMSLHWVNDLPGAPAARPLVCVLRPFSSHR